MQHFFPFYFLECPILKLVFAFGHAPFSLLHGYPSTHTRAHMQFQISDKVLMRLGAHSAAGPTSNSKLSRGPPVRVQDTFLLYIRFPCAMPCLFPPSPIFLSLRSQPRPQGREAIIRSQGRDLAISVTIRANQFSHSIFFRSLGPCDSAPSPVVSADSILLFLRAAAIGSICCVQRILGSSA